MLTPEQIQHFEQATVSALYYYPIKSCRGIKVDEWQVEATGFRHDREFMVVDAATCEAYTQRELSQLALVAPTIQGDTLTLNAPSMSTLEIPILREGNTLTAILWENECVSVDQGEEVARWFSEYLKVESRLVRMAENFQRKLDPKYAPNPQDHIYFPDGYPLLLISEESLEELNRRLDEPLPMNRFRANIVIKGSGIPHTEDIIKRFTLGNVSLNAVKPCARCKITTTNQETTLVGKEPLRTLATYRREESGKVMFGQNLIIENGGLLRVGDSLKINKATPPQATGY